MTPISIMIKRMARLPRRVRIAHIKAIIHKYPERSLRRKELEALLRDDMLAQLKRENAA